MSFNKSDALEALAAKRWRIAAVLTSGVLISYFGFILLVAFNKPLMGSLITEGLSLGILLGALVILSAWVFTGVYIIWANGTYDRTLHELKQQR